MPASEHLTGLREAELSGLSFDRVDEPEWLDLGNGSPADVAANLTEMWRLTRYFGGLPALTRHLYPRLAPAHGTICVVDLGTGSAEVPVSIARWARRRGLDVRLVAVDRAARNLAIARSRVASALNVHLLHADAACLPLPKESVDVVISSLLLHHFSPGQVVDLLRSAHALARRSLVMSDLVRGRLPSLAFRLIQPVCARNSLTRHDGALSIRRAYTPAELRRLAAAAGLPNAQVHVHWPWRMTLVADK
jgi:SAM-dependent methyltransferase